MKLSQTIKAAALSSALLVSQQGCFVSPESDNCSIDSLNPGGAVMRNSEEVAQFCKLNREAVITCVQTETGCAITQPSISSCSDYQHNQIIEDAITLNQYGGTMSVTCVEGEGISQNR